MTNERKGGDRQDNAGFMNEGGDTRRKGESPHRGQQGALGGSQSGQDHSQRRGAEELQGSRDQASGRRDEENLATRGESDITDREDTDIGSST